MLKSGEIRPQVAQRLRELLPTAKAWEETADTKISGQRVDLVAKFRLIDQEHTLVVEVSPLGQPRQIRAVVKRLEQLAWVEREESQKIRLGKPADLLESWCESYTYRTNEISSYVAPERVTRTFMSEIARVATAQGRRYGFTLNAGVSLVAPSLRVPAGHCYLEG